MRKLIVRSILAAAMAVVVWSAPASAASIPIGQLQWIVVESDEAGAPLLGQFSIINQTGVNFQGTDFPVMTQLLFNADMNLEVHLTAAPNENLGQADMESPDGGLSWDSAFFDASSPIYAALTGTVAPLLVSLNGGGMWNIVGGLFTVPGNLGNDDTTIEDGETAIIYVEATPVEAPEPTTLFLLGAGAMGLAARRRLTARR